MQCTKLEKGHAIASSRVGSSEAEGQFCSELGHGFVPFAVAPLMQNGEDDNFLFLSCLTWQKFHNNYCWL